MKKPDLFIPTYEASQFVWVGLNGSVDASDLGLAPGVEPGSQVWNDSCDVGFMVKGKQETRLFVLVCHETVDDEVMGWTFTDMSGRENGCQILVCND